MSSKKLLTLLTLLLARRTIAALLGTTASCPLPAAKELEGFNHHDVLAPLLAILTLPAMHLKAPLDQDRIALRQILGDDFSLACPGVDVNEAHFFLALAFGRFPLAVDGQAKLGYGRAAGSVAHLRVSGKIADQDDLVEVCHKPALSAG